MAEELDRARLALLLVPTNGCLESLGLSRRDLRNFVGLEVGKAEALAQNKGLMVFEAVIDGQPRDRIMILIVTG